MPLDHLMISSQSNVIKSVVQLRKRYLIRKPTVLCIQWDSVTDTESFTISLSFTAHLIVSYTIAMEQKLTCFVESINSQYVNYNMNTKMWW